MKWASSNDVGVDAKFISYCHTPDTLKYHRSITVNRMDSHLSQNVSDEVDFLGAQAESPLVITQFTESFHCSFLGDNVSEEVISSSSDLRSMLSHIFLLFK